MHPAPAGAPEFLYTLLVYIHFLGFIAAIGFNFTYVVWIIRGTNNRQHLDFALRGVKFLDDYIANPAYILLGLTGLSMILLGKSVKAYLELAIVIYLVTILVAYLVYTPLLSKQIKTLAAVGADAPEYQKVASRANRLGGVMALAVLIIIALKIFEPALWKA